MADLRQRIAGLSPKKHELLLRMLKSKGQELPRLRPMPRTGPVPLSYAQEGAWYLEQIQPGTPFNISPFFRLRGALDVDALESALNLVVRRHEVLRTTFTDIEGQPIQVVAPSLHIPVSTVDVTDHLGQRGELLKQIVETISQPFDLSRGPLLRMKVFRLNSEDHVVVFAVHHGVFDGWSINLFTEEVAAFYTALVYGVKVPLPDLPIQYADYAFWQRELLQGEFLQSQLGYWLKQLADHPAGLSIPTDHPESTAKLFRGDAMTFKVHDALAEALRTLARNERSTLFMVLLAAFKLLLARYSGQDDIVVGTPIANRSQPEQQRMIGFCVNLLALRTDLSGNPSFRQLLQRVREVCLNAYGHQELPFGVVVQHLHPDRRATDSPVFQVQFALQETRSSDLNVAGLLPNSFSPDDPVWQKVSEHIQGTAPAVDQIYLQMEDSGRELTGVVLYRTDLFDRRTIDRMITHFLRVLDGIVADADSSTIPLITEDERRQIFDEWNETQEEIVGKRVVHERVEAIAQQRPQAIAVTLSHRMREPGKDYELSYGELDRRANQLARRLHKQGVKPETRVGLCVGRSLDLAISLLGILKSGGVYVPLDLTQPRERLKKIIESSGLTVVVTREAERQTLGDLIEGSIVVQVDESREENTAKPHTDVQETNAAYVIYTSGSTGEPKGVIVSHANVVNHNVAVMRRFRLTPGDRVLQFHTVSFDAAVEELFPTWGAGATVVMRGEELVAPGEELERLIEQEQLTVLNLPTAYWHEWVLDGERRQEIAVNGLRLVIAGGDKVSAARHKSWRTLTRSSVTWVNTYGPTETTVISSFWEPSGEDEGEVSGGMSIGRPIGNTRMYVLDEWLNPVPIGVRGELWIAGDGVARGYQGRPDLTAERFMPDPFQQDSGTRMYRTGDRARYRNDGRLEFVGRTDEQVKIRGFRVELGEIESVLKRQARVQDAVVIAVEDAAGEKRLTAFVVPKEAQLTATELRESLNSELPGYMIPSGIVFLEQFPITPSGKIDRRALSKETNVDSTADQVYVEPRTPTEKEIARIWSELLDVERVGIHSEFFALGGHSLLAVKAISVVRSRLEVNLSLRDMFLHPTVKGLAEAVDFALVTGMTAPAPAIDLEREAELDSSITANGDMVRAPAGSEKIFLTGATGFLGAYLLNELLAGTNAVIYCLVRAASEQDGSRKLRQTLEKYGLWNEAASSRIVPVPGELSERRFGLTDDNYAELARSIDVIYHNGAWVNFMYPYSMLKGANVVGTEEILRLACHTKIKPVHHISTMSVFPHDRWAPGLIEEEWVVEGGNAINYGYAQSKWVAERMVVTAAARGIPVAVYRPGRISGDSRTGVWTADSQFIQSIQTILDLGSVPDLEGYVPFELVPVEYVSQAIVHLSRKPESLGKAFHVVNPQPISLPELVDKLGELVGVPLKKLAAERWFGEVFQFARRTPHNFLHSLLPMVPPDLIEQLEQAVVRVEQSGSATEISEPARAFTSQIATLVVDSTNTLDGLKDSGVSCLSVAELIDMYFKYFVRSGILKVARHEESVSIAGGRHDS